MPPASLSTFEVMSPGPTTARNRAMRLRQKAERRLKFVPRLFQAPRASVNVVQVFIARILDESFFSARFLELPAHPADYVVHRDCSDGMLLLVDDGEAAQIVFVEQFENVFVLGIRRNKKERLGSKIG